MSFIFCLNCQSNHLATTKNDNNMFGGKANSALSRNRDLQIESGADDLIKFTD